ncbi:hypothetical protein MTR67_031648 [Solanum verrucosum]|uniref:Uncharacterized protein n=1 Tax=Solanum verrucosum TaxID=315347 RepID=A0AAF0U2V6_SOLVR|nr:hypothetical protein MTR67_031648 [Solanum verrucosum]
MDSLPMIQEYANVFPTNLPSVPPDRDIDFAIDLERGTKTIYISPYHMALAKLKKLKDQLQDLLTMKAKEQGKDITSSPKVPAGQPMVKTNLASRFMVQLCAEWIGEVNLDLLKLQKKGGERLRQEGDGNEDSAYHRPGWRNPTYFTKKNEPPRKRARGIVIAEKAAPQRSTRPKLPLTGGKDRAKGKKPIELSLSISGSDIMGIHSTHLTTLESDRENNSRCKSPVYDSEPENDQTMQRRQAELRCMIQLDSLSLRHLLYL